MGRRDAGHGTMDTRCQVASIRIRSILPMLLLTSSTGKSVSYTYHNYTNADHTKGPVRPSQRRFLWVRYSEGPSFNCMRTVSNSRTRANSNAAHPERARAMTRKRKRADFQLQHKAPATSASLKRSSAKRRCYQESSSKISVCSVPTMSPTRKRIMAALSSSDDPGCAASSISCSRCSTGSGFG